MQDSVSLSDIMERLIKQNGAVNDTVNYLGKANGNWFATPATIGSQIKGPCSRIDLMNSMPASTCRRCIRRARRRRPTAGTTTPTSRPRKPAPRPVSIRRGPRPDDRLGRHRGRVLPRFGAELVNAKGDITVKTDPVRQATPVLRQGGQVLSGGCAGLGRRVEQQVARLGPRRADHESAQRLGGCQTRCAAGCRAVLDPWLPDRPEGAFRAVPALLLGRVELLEEHPRRPRACWSTCRRRTPPSGWCRRAAATICRRLQTSPTFKTWAEEVPPKGTLYPPPEPAQSSDAVGGGCPGTAQDRPSDLHPGDPDQDDRAPSARRGDGKDARLGRERGRRLHADVKTAEAKYRGRAALRARTHQACRGDRAGVKPAKPVHEGTRWSTQS